MAEPRKGAVADNQPAVDKDQPKDKDLLMVAGNGLLRVRLLTRVHHKVLQLKLLRRHLLMAMHQKTKPCSVPCNKQ